MRHLKNFNEEVKFDYEWDPECVRLQSIINTYNDRLFNDPKWKEHYHNIPLYYQKQKDSDFLESIIEFGKKRIIEIQQENEDDLKDIKDIFKDIDDSCEGVIESVKIGETQNAEDNPEIKMSVFINLSFTNEIIKERTKMVGDYLFTNSEIQILWPIITQITSVLESMGFQVGLNYRPNMTDAKFLLIKKY